MIVESALAGLMLAPALSGGPIVQAEFRDPVEQVVVYPPESVVERMTGLLLPAAALAD